MRASSWRGAASAAALLVAVPSVSCGGTATNGAADKDGGTTAPPNEYPAPHPPIPLVTNLGGATLVDPQLVTVTFQGDTLASELDAFSDAIPTSTWWKEVSSDYGVGPLTSAAHVTITDTPPAQLTDSVMGGPSSLDTFLQEEVTAGVLPDPTENSTYLLYLPQGVSVLLDSETSCTNGGFAGYHQSAKITPKAGGAAIDSAYAVVVRCNPPVPALGMTEQTYMTLTGSHELIESTTDGKPVSQGFAWVLNNLGWGILGPEVADLCADNFGTGQDQWSEGGFVYQRSWSNSSVNAGLDPCVPIPSGETYFNAAAQADTVVLGVGGKTTVEFDAFSTAPMAAWQLSAVDLGAATDTANPTSSLTLTLDKKTAANGDAVHLTIELNAAIPAYGQSFPAKTTVVYLFSVDSTGNTTVANWWPLVVQQQ